ncbi:MAG TPA: acyltransferase, partial [Vicinamibacterales bacterium]|nr:acyltransferase [Vicinamibacterales bacterium]
SDRACFGRYAVRRWFRIQPPYMAAVLLAWLVSQAIVPPGAAAAGAPWLRVPAARLPVALAFPSRAFGLLGVGWSLYVELAMSLFFPLLFVLGRRIHPLAAVAVGLLLLRDFDPRWRFLRFSIDFALGLALYLSAAPIASVVRRWPRAVAATAVVGGVGLLQAPYMAGLANTGFAGLEHGHGPWAVASFGLGAALLVIAAVHLPALERVFSSPLGRFYGRISYSLYLVHHTVLFVFLFRLRPPGYEFAWPAAIAVFAATLLVSTVLAVLGFRWVEEPAMRAGRASIRALAALVRRRSS